MKVYRFKIKKVMNNTIQIEDESYKKAVKHIVQILAGNEDMLFENAPEKENFYDLKLVEISEKFDEEEEENLEEIEEEIVDDLPREYKEIVCEKCGNCIPIDNDFMS